MVKPDIVVNQYPIQAYKTIFNQKTGFLIRLEDNTGVEPFWCSFGPELLDISITNWCDRECSFCYKESNEYGSHMGIDKYLEILQQAMNLRVLQVALGGGNPNQHPDFCDILQLTREKFNIIPSYTTNGRGLTQDVLMASKKYCGAVAISAYEPFEETFFYAKKLIENGIRTNIHFLLTYNSIKTAIEWLEKPPRILDSINAIVFLNYKPLGRNPDQELLVKNSPDLSTFFDFVRRKYPFKIGFDSCSISGIARHLDVSPIYVDRCEAGRFSMYISEDMKIYPCSFMANKIEGVPIIRDNIQSVWRSNSDFLWIRQKLKINPCPDCSISGLCFGGCPIYPEINFC